MRGIPFKARLVRAIMAGVKTETRRVARSRHFGKAFDARCKAIGVRAAIDELDSLPYPYGRPGDPAYVKEQLYRDVGTGLRESVCYEADGAAALDAHGRPAEWGWKVKTLPSIFMPRWAARTFMQLAAAKVERLLDIDDAGALAEGITFAAGLDLFGRGPTTRDEILERPRAAFLALWDIINGPRGMGTDVNPWLWVPSWTAESIEVRS